MTENNPSPAHEVADLIETAMDDLGGVLASTDDEERRSLATRADLKIKAAQAVATLAHARETRVLALATLAGLDPAKIEQGGPLPREAYLAAARALGLVEEEPVDEAALEELRAALTGDDPADADLGDLK